MVVIPSLLAPLIGVLLVLSVGAAGGFALVAAWQRFGDRVPNAARRPAALLLGPRTETTTNPSTGPETDPQGTEAGGETEAAEAGSPDDAPGSPDGDEGGDREQEAPVQASDNEEYGGEEEGSPTKRPQTKTSERDDSGDPPSTKGGVVKQKRPPRVEVPEYTTTRADAVEEISAIFDTSYEEADALIKSGMWGMENHVEWVRAMQDKQPPPGVSKALFKGVLNASPNDYAPLLEQLRTKRVALEELKTLWGVGPDHAQALYEAGFKDVESIRKTSTDKLAKTPGIGPALAFQIRAAAHGLAPTP